MLVCTIESSCDETSVAIIEDGRHVRSVAVASQIPIHRRYGGVVPEIASRNHIRDIHTVLDDALAEAGVELADVDGFGVTAGPGLVGSLLVGIETAKALAYVAGKPCVGLNHIEGHLTAVMLELDGEPSPEFPFIGMVASGGHSDIYWVEGFGEYTSLGRTRDDAAGEAFDKVAKMLGLPYPGGIEIDQLARSGDPAAIDFPRPMWTRKNLDMSFAGLKTSVRTHLKTHGVPEGQALSDLCASFQQAVVDVLVMKTFAAVTKKQAKRVVLSGGVACNSVLRAAMRAEGERRGVRIHIAPPWLCTDNAAMLGPIAHHYLAQGAEASFEGFDIKANGNMPLGQSARPDSKGPHR